MNNTENTNLLDLKKLSAAFSILLLAYVLRLRRRRQQTRRFKRRPINRARRLGGSYTYYKKMKSWDPQQFFKFTRMTIPAFEKLINFVRPLIEKQQRSDGICAEERLVITLQYLSQGTSMQALAWHFQLGLTTVHVIIHETCKAIWETLSQEYLMSPCTEQEWLNIADGFLVKWNFPHCLGALDGKHINIQAPPKSGSLYFNYKKTFSVVLLASCDSKYRFTLVDIGAYGSQSDGGIFRLSTFGQRLEESNLNIPHEKCLPNSNLVMPFCLVADEAFPLKKFIMRPYGGRNLTDSQKIFNYRLSRARQTIENTFGILAARWRILKTTIIAKPAYVDNIIKAATVLHNYCQVELGRNGEEQNLYCPPGFTDTNDERNGLWRQDQTPLQSVGRLSANIARRETYAARERLTNYFLSVAGQVPWQTTIIRRGRFFN